MNQKQKLLLIAGASTLALCACGKKDAVNSDTTAMRIDSTADSMLMRTDSARLADSLRLDSTRRADSLRIIDTLVPGKKRGTP